MITHSTLYHPIPRLLRYTHTHAVQRPMRCRANTAPRPKTQACTGLRWLAPKNGRSLLILHTHTPAPTHTMTLTSPRDCLALFLAQLTYSTLPPGKSSNNSTRVAKVFSFSLALSLSLPHYIQPGCHVRVYSTFPSPPLMPDPLLESKPSSMSFDSLALVLLP